jgi:hypothetical protein
MLADQTTASWRDVWALTAPIAPHRLAVFSHWPVLIHTLKVETVPCIYAYQLYPSQHSRYTTRHTRPRCTHLVNHTVQIEAY